MKLLLDTATLIWIANNSDELSASARTAYLDVSNDVYLSVASIWEIVVKNRLGKLPLNGTIEQIIEPMKASGTIQVLSLDEAAVFRLQTLPPLHRDPFDRMLICQAIQEGMTIVTPDREISRYPVAILW